jgi:hypothetical protein
MHARNLATVVAIGALLSGCDMIFGPGGPEIKQAEKMVASTLKDPSSAQFKNVAFHPADGRNPESVCGEINGKNSYGGYEGFSRFVVNLTKNTSAIGPASTPQSDGDLDARLAQSTFDLTWMTSGCGLFVPSTAAAPAVSTPTDDASLAATAAAEAKKAADAAQRAASGR